MLNNLHARSLIFSLTLLFNPSPSVDSSLDQSPFWIGTDIAVSPMIPRIWNEPPIGTTPGPGRKILGCSPTPDVYANLGDLSVEVSRLLFRGFFGDTLNRRLFYHLLFEATLVLNTRILKLCHGTSLLSSHVTNSHVYDFVYGLNFKPEMVNA